MVRGRRNDAAQAHNRMEEGQMRGWAATLAAAIIGAASGALAQPEVPPRIRSGYEGPRLQALLAARAACVEARTGPETRRAEGEKLAAIWAGLRGRDRVFLGNLITRDVAADGAAISVMLSPGIVLETARRSRWAPDVEDTLVPAGSPIHRALATMAEGSLVAIRADILRIVEATPEACTLRARFREMRLVQAPDR